MSSPPPPPPPPLPPPPPIPAGTLFSDDFSGSSLGSNWAVVSGAFTESNDAALGISHSSYAVWVGMPDPNAAIGVTLGAPTSPTWAGVIARAASGDPSSDHYAAYLAPDGTVGLARRNGYDFSYLASAPLAAGSHTISLTASGSAPVTLTVTVDGNILITASDSSSQALASGQAGIFDYNGASRPLQHFTVGP
jgi:hypothetical protein